MNFPPDSALRTRALDPATSFIVEAPAGSGKTTLLVNRFLNLLVTVERPESIVAMTFTRKAAAEMRERVLQRLRQAAEPGTDELAAAALAHSAKQGWNLDRDPSRLQIQTIDSLCAMLTRQMPVVSDLGGSAEVLEHVDELYVITARRTMAELAEGNETEQALFRRLSLHFDSDLSALERQLVTMLGKREQWRHVATASVSPEIQDFCELLTRAQRDLRRVFQLAGKVDFPEVTRAAIAALGEPESPSDLLYALDYRIQHLLVDEFQDTSRSQYELIAALTGQWSDGDGRTLFLVGDPMQSIYMFRQAEISLFLDCWKNKRLGAVRLKPLRLVANFRSTTELVDWTQQAFSPILQEDNSEIGAVKMRPAQADPSRHGVSPAFKPFINDDGKHEAQHIVEILRQLPSRRDTAILVRSRGHLAAILPALRSAGIAYEAIEIDQLRDQQHILDVLSLTRAILHTGDQVAWLACLRAPWCGLTLAGLSALVEGQKKRTVFELLSDPETFWRLPPDARERAARVQEIMAHAVRSAGRMPLRGLVQRTWMALGGPAVLQHPVHREDVNTLLDLLEQFDEGGVIRDFTLLDAKMEFLYARTVPDDDAVKVMTIHSAKGLEFETVIVPQLAASRIDSDRDLLVWSDDRVAAKPRGNVEDGSPYDQILQQQKAKGKEELKRLLYVAVTRAKSRLYLSGCLEQRKGGALGAAWEGSFLKLIYPQYQAEFESLNRRTFKVAPQASVAEPPVTQLRRLQSEWHTPELDTSVSWRPQVRSAPASGRTITYEWVSDTGRHVGTLVHRVLKRIGREGVASWSAERIETMRPLFRSELRRLGVTDLDDAVAKAARALQNTMVSEKGRWILGPQRERRSEWAISGRLGNTLIDGSVDCSFRDDQQRLWIVDFKTSEHSGGNLDRFLNEEERRYRAQLENYASLIANLEPGPIWLGLYFPLHDAWRAWAFVEEAAAVSGL